MINSGPLDKFYHWEKTAPHTVFLRQPIKGQWVEYSYGQAGKEIRNIATALKALSLAPGSNIAILSKNCAHWIMADLAIWMAGHVSIPIYPSLSASAIRYLLEHSRPLLGPYFGKLIFVMSSGIPDSCFP